MRSFSDKVRHKRRPPYLLGGLAVTTAILLVTVQSAHAALLGYEPFNYDTGAVLNGFEAGTGWTGPWFSEDAVTVQDVDLIFGGQSGGPKAAQISGADFLHLMSRPFAATDDTLYIGMQLRAEVFDDFMQLQVSDGETGNATGTMTIGLDARDPIGFYARTGTSGDGSTFSDNAVLATQTDYFLVGKFSKDGGDTYNRVDFFVDPGDSEPATADAIRLGVDTGLNQLSLFTVRTALMEGDEQIFLDELRVGTAFNDVLLSGVDLPDPGDFNDDNMINLVDYDILRGNFKEAGNFTSGDMNFDGFVDLVDFNEFAIVFEAANPGVALAPIPEPSTLVLFFLGCSLWLHRARRRKRV